MSTVTIVHQLDRDTDGYASLVKDCEVLDQQPDTNYSVSDFHVGLQVAADKGDETIYNAFLQFDISTVVPVSATITAATLYLEGGGFQATDTVALKRLTRYDWVESEVTWHGWKEPMDGLIHAVLSAGNDTVTVAGSPNWEVDEWIGVTVLVHGGTGAGQEREVVSNTIDTLTITSNWTTNPDDTSSVKMNMWTTAGGDGSTPEYTGVTAPTGTDWWSTTVTNLVTDARTNRNDIVNILMVRDDGGVADGYGIFNHKGEEAGNLLSPHLRITYTLDSKTFQAFVFDKDAIAADVLLSGTIGAQSGLSAVLVRTRPLSGSVGLQSSLSAALARIRPVSGTISVQAAVSGALVRLRPLAGSVNGQSALTGALVRARPLSGTIAALSTVDAALSRLLALSGNVAGQSALSASLIRLLALSGAIDGQSGISGALIRELALSGTVVAVSTIAGHLVVLWYLQGTIAAVSTLNGILFVPGPDPGVLPTPTARYTPVPQFGIALPDEVPPP